MTNNKDKKSKFKHIAVKVVNIIAYILSALFVLLMTVVGLQSCKDSKATAVNADVLPIANLSKTKWHFNEYIDVSSEFSVVVNFQLDSGSTFTGITSTNEYLLYDYSNDSDIVYASEGWDDSNYQYITIVDGEDVDNEQFIEWLYNNATNLTILTNFVFNKTFNYNAPLGLGIAQQYGGNISLAPTTIVGGIYRFTYNVGQFYSNGSLYNQIVIDYLNAGACYYDVNGVIRQGTSDMLSYFALGYKRLDNGLIDFVNYRDNLIGTLNGNSVTYTAQASTWVNDSYRYLTLYQTFSNEMRVKVEAFNNNNQSEYSGVVYNSETNNVFTLLASAFTGLIPVLSIAVLPGISLGILLFIPLVATLIFAIIKIIKK